MSNNEQKKKRKVILPLTLTGALLIGGIGACTWSKSTNDNEVKKEDVVEDVNNNNDNDNNNNENENNNNNENENNNNNNNNNENDDYENNDINNNNNDDIVLERDEDGNLSFSKNDNNDFAMNDSDDYSHLKDEVRDKVEKDGDLSFVIEDGKLVVNDKDKDKDKDDDLIAGLVPDKDKDKEPSDKDDSPNKDEDNNTGGNNNTGGDNNTGGNENPDPKPDPEPEKPTDPEPEKPTDPEPEKPTDPEPEKPTDPEPEKPVEVNKDKLNSLIAEINDKHLKQEYFTTSTWNALMTALNDAIDVRNNKDAKQSEVDKAVQDLQDKYDQLVYNDPKIEIVGLEDLDENNSTTESTLDLLVHAINAKGAELTPTVVLNGTVVDLSEDGLYELNLDAGVNELIVEVSDSLTGITEQVFEINYIEELAPIITVGDVSNDNVIDGILTFDVKAEDYKGNSIDVTVKHNGSVVDVNDNMVSVSLIEGINNFEVIAIDKDGNESIENFEVFYEEDEEIVEPDAPTLDVIGLDESYIEDGKISFTIDAKDGYGKDVLPVVEHNDTIVESNNGIYTVELVDGLNTFYVWMETDQGFYISQTVYINYEEETEVEDKNPGVKPVLIVNGLDSDYIEVTDDTISFNVSSTDGNGKVINPDVYFNQYNDITNEAGQYTVKLQEGNNYIYIRSEDEFGNVSVRNVTVKYSGDWDNQYDEYEEVLWNGEIGNSGKEFNTPQEATDWAIDNWDEWIENGYDGYWVLQIDYWKIDEDGNRIAGTNRKTWTVDYYIIED